MLYKFLRPLFFALDPEMAHQLGLEGLKFADKLGLLRHYSSDIPSRAVEVMGLKFPSHVGLAAGLDKNGDYIHALGSLGFGFVEIGTVTPRPQAGNSKPRLFRIPEKFVIINRMGFNNKGVDHLVDQVKRSQFNGILGINIGKNFDTPNDRAVDDYLHCLNRVYPYADYITVNISSPNTKGLRELQQQDAIRNLMQTLKNRQAQLHQELGKYTPLVVKIAPDLNDEEIAGIAQQILAVNMDGVIATNTTLARDAVQGFKHADEQGGLSGAPLLKQSTHVVAELHKHLNNKVPIIAAGGIMCGEDAQEKLNAGASLVQIYTGFVYQGPELIKLIKQTLA